MGPIRRRLILAALLTFPSAAMAEVCNKQWDGTPVSAWQELLISFQSPVVLLLLFATAIAIRFRSQWGGLAAVVGWSIYIFVLMQNEMHRAEVAEGCAGSPSLFLGVITLLSAGVILYTAPTRKEP